jgi:hypothetical protein
MNCICGHRDQAHVAGGRCRVPDCPCERFQPGDTVPEPASATHDFPVSCGAFAPVGEARPPREIGWGRPSAPMIDRTTAASR